MKNAYPKSVSTPRASGRQSWASKVGGPREKAPRGDESDQIADTLATKSAQEVSLEEMGYFKPRDEAALSLTIPDWVPASVRILAETLWRDAIQHVDPATRRFEEAVQRLATNSKMRPVWRQLQRRVGGAQRGGQYLHPACPTNVKQNVYFKTVQYLSHHTDEQERVQEQAIALLFIEAAFLFGSDRDGPFGPSVRTKGAVENANHVVMQHAARYQKDAALPEIRNKMSGLLQLRVPQADGSVWQQSIRVPASKLLHALADGLREQVEIPFKDHPLIVARSSKRAGGNWERGLIIRLLQLVSDLFATQTTFATVATIANVGLNRDDITKGMVQGIVRR